jgi:hypothetical protein
MKMTLSHILSFAAIIITIVNCIRHRKLVDRLAEEQRQKQRSVAKKRRMHSAAAPRGQAVVEDG